MIRPTQKCDQLNRPDDKQKRRKKLMFDFSSIPFFDNHTHRIDVSNREIKPIDLGIAFMHGWGPINPTARRNMKKRS